MGKKILITGGTGSFGNQFISKIIKNKKYSDIVEALYGDKKTIDINTSVKLQDGGVQKINTKLNIINMENIYGI